MAEYGEPVGLYRMSVEFANRSEKAMIIYVKTLSG